MNYDMLTILGPTASGKTAFAVQVAKELDAEIISADSRQIYRRMDIGTGKDLSDYKIDGKNIPYHLIDIADAGYKYNLFEYQRDFHDVYEDLKRRSVFPILCGGTGLYLESVLKGYKMMLTFLLYQRRVNVCLFHNCNMWNDLYQVHRQPDTVLIYLHI